MRQMVVYTLQASRREHLTRGQTLTTEAGSDLDKRLRGDPAWTRVELTPIPHRAPPGSTPAVADQAHALAVAIGNARTAWATFSDREREAFRTVIAGYSEIVDGLDFLRPIVEAIELREEEADEGPSPLSLLEAALDDPDAKRTDLVLLAEAAGVALPSKLPRSNVDLVLAIRDLITSTADLDPTDLG